VAYLAANKRDYCQSTG